jgi:hypothetical protein
MTDHDDRSIPPEGDPAGPQQVRQWQRTVKRRRLRASLHLRGSGGPREGHRRHSPRRGMPASRDRRISRDAVAEWFVSSPRPGANRAKRSAAKMAIARQTLGGAESDWPQCSTRWRHERPRLPLSAHDRHAPSEGTANGTLGEGEGGSPTPQGPGVSRLPVSVSLRLRHHPPPANRRKCYRLSGCLCPWVGPCPKTPTE